MWKTSKNQMCIRDSHYINVDIYEDYKTKTRRIGFQRPAPRLPYSSVLVRPLELNVVCHLTTKTSTFLNSVSKIIIYSNYYYFRGPVRYFFFYRMLILPSYLFQCPFLFRVYSKSSFLFIIVPDHCTSSSSYS